MYKGRDSHRSKGLAGGRSATFPLCWEEAEISIRSARVRSNQLSTFSADRTALWFDGGPKQPFTGSLAIGEAHWHNGRCGSIRINPTPVGRLFWKISKFCHFVCHTRSAHFQRIEGGQQHISNQLSNTGTDGRAKRFGSAMADLYSTNEAGSACRSRRQTREIACGL